MQTLVYVRAVLRLPAGLEEPLLVGWKNGRFRAKASAASRTAIVSEGTSDLRGGRGGGCDVCDDLCEALRRLRVARE